MQEREIGRVTDYYKRVSVAGIQLAGTLHRGDRIHIRGHTTDIDQVADSIEIDHEKVEEAGPGQSVGVKVPGRVRPGDHVYLISG